MKINEFYKICLNMDCDTSVRVYIDEVCEYCGYYAYMPYHLAAKEFSHCLHAVSGDWKFYCHS